MGRSASSLSREVRRNSTQLGYLPDSADIKARCRKHKLQFKIDRYPALKQFVIEKLSIDKWSPEIIAARIKRESFAASLSHETIYKFIYSSEGQRSKLYQHLMYRRPKRQLHHSRVHRIAVPEKHKIANRPDSINSRSEFGHFEGDLTFFKGSSSANLITLVERVTRKAFVIRNNNKKSVPTMNRIRSTMASLPAKTCKSITFDNGKEFKKFAVLSLLGAEVYFCKPASPWQKGQVERINAQLHKFIRKSSDIKLINQEMVCDAQNKLNNLPRKVLNFLTPNEAWDIHLKSTVALQT
jgi:IS30 family transposase